MSYARDSRWHKRKTTPPFVEAIGATEPLAIVELARGITGPDRFQLPRPLAAGLSAG